MTGPGLPTSGSAAENELLARLGLPKSASPEDLDNLHQAASQYLASAPPELRRWAHAQATALDEAYLQLTDPVGLQGSALRSPARPPAVVPGGPATPPARRGSAPATDPIPAAALAAADAGIEPTADDPDTDDLALLYASVTPSAHPDMLPDAKPKPKAATRPVAAPIQHRKAIRPAAAAAATAPQAANPWKRLVIASVAVIAIVAVGFGGIQVVGAIGGDSQEPGAVAQATQGPPAVDLAKVSSLMESLAANPNDTVALLALADEYYAGEQYADAGNWLDKLLAIEPENVDAMLARGAVSFNLGSLPAAETTWKKVLVIDPKNAEAHYDLGFLYLNQTPPDWTAVQREWNTVIDLDPTSPLAQTVRSHLDSLAQSSMIPGNSPAASPALSTTPAPSASPAASTVP